MEGAGGAAGPGRASSRRAEPQARRADGERAGGPDGARNTGGAANGTPVAQQQRGYVRGPEVEHHPRASTQASLFLDEIQPRAALAHEEAEVAVLVSDGGIASGNLLIQTPLQARVGILDRKRCFG